MRSCDNCIHKDGCTKKICWTNEYGMVTNKEISLCSEYEKDLRSRYDLTELYKILFNYDEVLTIYRKEIFGPLQDLIGETKLYLIVDRNIDRAIDIEICEKIHEFKELHNLETKILFDRFNEQTFKSIYYNDKDFEKIERGNIE